MGIQKLFETKIYKSPCLLASSSLHKSLLKEASQIESMDTEGHIWCKKNYPNGYTSYGSIDQLHLMSPHFMSLKKKLDQHVAKYIKALNWDVSVNEIQISKLWVNIMKTNTIHTMHIHPLSVVSGTFYVQAPSNGSPIKFEDPRHVLFMNRPPVKSSVKKEQAFLTVKPKAGDIILFESWIRHEVPLHTDPTNRISISFNYDWI